MKQFATLAVLLPLAHLRKARAALAEWVAGRREAGSGGGPRGRPAGRRLKPMKQKQIAVAVAAAFALCAIALSWPVADLGPPRSSDRTQYERIAFNLARHGVFHDTWQESVRELAAEQPYSRREPGYPLYLAAVFAFSPEFATVGHGCVDDPDCEAAAPLRERVWRLTFLLGAAAVAVTFLATFVLTRSWTVATAFGGLSLLLTPLVLIRDVPSFLAGLFLLVHATLAARTWRQPRIATGVLSGLALGLLVLTKAVFQYWLAGVALVLVAGLWRDADRRRTLAPACAALVLAAWVLTLPWMVRNAVEVGHFGISGRDGELLAIRAEYGRMTWPELRGAFAYYLPDVDPPSDQIFPFRRARAFAMRWLEPDHFGYVRMDRANPRGFYTRARRDGDVVERADRISLAPGWRQSLVARDAVLKRAAVDLIREDWVKHAALTLVFAERGLAFPTAGCSTLIDPAAHRFGTPIGWAVGSVCRLAREGTLLVWPFAGLLAFLAWRRRDVSLALLLLPAAYSFGIHAAATEYIARYSLPLLPVLVVATALAVHELVRARRTTFVLFVAGILAYGAAATFADYMLNRFDLVNLLGRVGGRSPAIRSDFDVHLLDDTVVYAKDPCVPEDVAAPFFLHVDPIDPDDLPGPRRRNGFDNLDFRFDDLGSLIGGVCVVEVPLPEYGIAAIRTGQLERVEGGFQRLWGGEIRLGAGAGRR